MRMRFFTGLLVSASFLLAFAPAVFAQAVIEDDDGDTSVQYVDCSQVQNAFANQGQYANANAAADDESEAVAEVSQELNISQSQVNACLGSIGGNPDGNNPPGDETTGPTERQPADEETTDDLAEGRDAVDRDTVLAADELPETGGPGFAGVVLASGCALLGVGLILNRIVR
ncbi:MAG: hypothetical protein AVDCRST_MAG02-258 [uncultured Rubrobacteraceae bacterium]|uniref:Gram-positive cocci surface proteins LPxTG domain-containing protein n=1 Tax=uncultured Rubrobacteraceae bacterium TaxID=349277 RepID=A0A6J4QPX6_9ACTN|nr:MAG: hypothetical protein AVDCRST_MAG02-258 [uncultured Rubrobacteraceae bacterium]